MFSKTSFLRSEKLFLDSESEVVQSLTEFRVLVQQNIREQRKKEHKQLYRFLPQTGCSHVPLALPRRIPLKCNVGLQVAQSHKKETSLLKDNSKRLLFSITQERDFYAQGQLQETSFAQSQLKETSIQLQRIEYLIYNQRYSH